MVTYCYVCDGKGNKIKELWDNVLYMCLVVDDVGYVEWIGLCYYVY